MKILVTGAEGVIGKELMAILKSDSSNEIHTLDKKSGFDLAIGDIKGVLNHCNPEIVFHLAASFERTKETPEAFNHIWENDTLASHRLLEAIKYHESVKVVVFASSYLIYNNALGGYNEGSEINPRNLCGMSKLYTEKELEFICNNIRPDIRHVNARIFRVYGCGGKELISRWCRAKVLGEKVQIFNEENRYDYIHARDVAIGLHKLAFTQGATGIVNLGSGYSRSVRDVADIIGVETEKVEDDKDSESSCASIGKLTKLTGWWPSITLEDGIKEVLAYEAKGADNVSR